MSKFHEISIKGKHWLHRIADVYTHEGSVDKARMVYSEDDEKVYVGSGTAWLKFTTAYDVLGQGSKVLMGTFPLPTGWNIDTTDDDIMPTFTPIEGNIDTVHGAATWTIVGIQGGGAHNHGGRTKGAQGDTILIGESDIYNYVGDDKHNHNIQNAAVHFHSFTNTWRPAYIKYCVAEYQ
jgi:hypothetical protein